MKNKLTYSKISLLFLPCLTLFLCEFMIYFFVQYQCNWPKLQKAEEIHQLKALFIADTHLLGPYRGHWFDKLRREWQMSTSFLAAKYLHSPDVIFFLGDVFDEGQWVNEKEHEEYVQRFHYLFPAHNRHVIVGNHDVGFHYVMNRRKLERFYGSFNISSSSDLLRIDKVTFVTLNSMAMEEDGCNICQEAEKRIQHIAAQIKPGEKSILLQHFPLFRISDKICDGEDAAPVEERDVQFRPKMDCLSESSSQWLLRTLKPRLVFSGHTHHSCVYHHGQVVEYSVPSFSWRNRNNPSYLLVTLSPEDFSVYKCFIPRESTVVRIYMASALLFMGIGAEGLVRRWRQKRRLKAA